MRLLLTACSQPTATHYGSLAPSCMPLTAEDALACRFGRCCAARDASSMLGFFANSDGFYGRPAWTEYLLLQRAADDRLEAVKIVGDRNVPRGQRTWRTAPGYFGEPTARAYIQLHLRDDPSDPDGYMWSPGDHEIAWDAGQLYDSDSCEEGLLCRFIIIGPNPTGEFESVFYRVNEATALEAARQFTDAQ